MLWMESLSLPPVRRVIATITLSILPPLLLFAASDDAALTTGQLTKYKWSTNIVYGGNTPSDTTVWEFYKGGAFRRRMTADYTVERLGHWAIDSITSDTGLLFFAERKIDAGESRYGVLSLKLTNEKLQLGELFYLPVAFTGKERQPVLREEASLLDTASREQFYALWFKVSAHVWNRQDNDRAGQPDRYTFSREGTYAASFSAVGCHYTGTWSLYIQNQTQGEIWLTVPSHHCGAGGIVEPSLLIMPLMLKEKTLMLSGAKFTAQQ